MKIGVIIQARKGSTRLPGKVVMPFFNKECILEIIIKRIAIKYPNIPIILATTVDEKDDEVVFIGESLGVNVFRGSEENVLSRFTEIIKAFELEGVIRVCADNPFLDVDSFNEFLNWQSESKADYIGFGISATHPTIKTHFGLWAEYVSAAALVKAEKLTQKKLFMEHVTNFIYGNANHFEVEIHELPYGWGNKKDIRFTLDSMEDFNILQSIYSNFKDMELEMTPKNLIEYVDENPGVSEMMKREIARWEK